MSRLHKRISVVLVLWFAVGSHCIQNQTIKPEINSMAESADKPPDAARFVDNGDNTVTDTQTGLMWAKLDSVNDVHGGLNWEGSKAFVGQLDLGGRYDWRMPTIAELQTLYDQRFSVESCWDSKPAHMDPVFAPHGAIWQWSCEEVETCCVRFFDFCDGEALKARRTSHSDCTGVRAVCDAGR